MPWASTPTSRRVPAGARHRRPEQRVDLLRDRARRGRRLGLGIAGGDRDLGARAVLAVAHEPGDVGGERLGLEGLAQHHLVDRLVHDLLEARHVRALLLGPEVDEALELGIEELLVAVRADADDLLHTGHPDARQAHVGRGTTGLDVASEECCRVGHWTIGRYLPPRARQIAQVVVLWPDRLYALDFAPNGQPLAVITAAQNSAVLTALMGPAVVLLKERG